MLYLLLDWEDRIDPEFDFTADGRPDRRKDSHKHHLYAHEFFKTPPYDGILTSIALFEGKIRLSHEGRKVTIRGLPSIKDYLRLPTGLIAMGDCGAFSYVNQLVPPTWASPERVATLHQQLQFDLGVSPDHVILNAIYIEPKQKYILTEDEKEQRRQITLRNASAFLAYMQKNNFTFTPLGAVQGYNLQTYVDSAQKLVEMGYTYLAVGGLVRYPTAQIREIVEAIWRKLRHHRPPIKLHLLGILRLQLLDLFRDLEIASFDSPSFLRKA